LHATVTRRFILQKARRHTENVLRLFVGTRFQVLFHSPPGVLFTFPSRYWFTIGRQVVFSLRRWSSLLPTRFHVSRGTQGTSRRDSHFDYRIVTFFDGSFQTASSMTILCNSYVRRPTTPEGEPSGLGYSAFARRYLRNHYCFLFLRVLRCFSSPGMPLSIL
jgi:hypothetical protein